MQEKKKGFTLIELLAVIVILAVIALIATPIVLNLIKTAKKGAFARSAEGVLKSAKLYYTSSLLDIEGATDITFNCNNKECVSNQKDTNGNPIRLDVDGSMGTGTVEISNDGKISISLCDGTYCAVKAKDEEKITVSNQGDTPSCSNFDDNGNCITTTTYITGDAVTLGGYNWHVIGDTGTNVTLLMDANQLGSNSNMNHCTDDTDDETDCGVDETGTYYVYSWYKSKIRTYLNSTLLSDLESKISNTIVSTEICADPSRGDGQETYGGYLMSEVNKISGATCSSILRDKVRLITNLEYYNMSPYYTSTSISSNSDYKSWLYCSSSSCGNSSGWWWTMSSDSTSVDSHVELAISVESNGQRDGHSGYYAYGVRPVITIVK